MTTATMSAKAIREATGKAILNKALEKCPQFSPCRFVPVDENNLNDSLLNGNPWLASTPLVVKPDQLIKRRGKLGLIKVNVDYPGVKTWLGDMMLKEIKVSFRKHVFYANILGLLFFKTLTLNFKFHSLKNSLMDMDLLIVLFYYLTNN